MQVREVMTGDVATVGPDDAVKHVGGLLAQRGFAAVPVVDDDGRLVGIVAEADILRGRVPADPRLHLRRDRPATGEPPSSIAEIMTTRVLSVDAGSDVSDVAALLLEEKLRSVPVLDGGRLVGIVSRRDLLRALVRSDESIAADLQQMVEEYTGEPGAWDVAVHDGVATIARATPGPADDVEVRALTALARTVGGVVGVRVTAQD
jgi:CBS domain-containing protein